MERYLILLLLVILEVSQIFAQDKQEIPKDFFMGKWGGTISGEIKLPDDGSYNLPFSLRLIGHAGCQTATLIMNVVRLVMDSNGDWIPENITVIDNNAVCGIYSEMSPPVFVINFSQDFGKRILSLNFNTYFLAQNTKMKPKHFQMEQRFKNAR